MARPPSPSMGSGPVNYIGGDPASPSGPFNDNINYSDMSQYQAVSQYQTMPPQSYNMAPPVYNQILSHERFQYGLMQGQDPRAYNRQQEMYRAGIAASLAQTGMMVPSWAAGAMLGAAVGGPLAPITSVLGGLAAGAMPPFSWMSQGIEREADRMRYASSISRDAEMYRQRLGLGGASYNQMSMLGGQMANKMFALTPENRQQFFSSSQQMDLLKTFTANDMISSKSGDINSGTIQQYVQNFTKLLETTKFVIKALNTTKEGAVSMMQEMKTMGFLTPNQMMTQTSRAAGLGAMTGLGSQNMMQLGASGAAAVAGTPWEASVGASMYQTNAAIAAGIANNSFGGYNAVRRMGGIAQAGASLATSQMNVLQSNFGRRFAAYSMNADGGINEDALQRVLGGGVGGYEMVLGADKTGYGMGFNRVKFPWYQQDLLNKLSDTERVMAVRRIAEAWGGQRYGSTDVKMAKFAQLMAGTGDAGRLMYEQLMGNSSVDVVGAEQSAAKQLAIMGSNTPMSWIDQGLFQAKQNIMGAGAGITSGINDQLTGIGRGWSRFTSAVGGQLNLYTGRMVGRESGYRSVMDPVDYQRGLRASYGLGLDVTPQDVRTYSRASTAQKQAMITRAVNLENYGISDAALQHKISSMSADDLGTFLTQTRALLGDPNGAANAIGMSAGRGMVSGPMSLLTPGMRDQLTHSNMQNRFLSTLYNTTVNMAKQMTNGVEKADKDYNQYLIDAKKKGGDAAVDRITSATQAVQDFIHFNPMRMKEEVRGAFVGSKYDRQIFDEAYANENRAKAAKAKQSANIESVDFGKINETYMRLGTEYQKFDNRYDRTEAVGGRFSANERRAAELDRISKTLGIQGRGLRGLLQGNAQDIAQAGKYISSYEGMIARHFMGQGIAADEASLATNNVLTQGIDVRTGGRFSDMITNERLRGSYVGRYTTGAGIQSLSNMEQLRVGTLNRMSEPLRQLMSIGDKSAGDKYTLLTALLSGDVHAGAAALKKDPKLAQSLMEGNYGNFGVSQLIEDFKKSGNQDSKFTPIFEALLKASRAYELSQADTTKKKTSSDEGASGSSLDARVASPVLNYWNNRWVL